MGGGDCEDRGESGAAMEGPDRLCQIEAVIHKAPTPKGGVHLMATFSNKSRSRQ